MANGFGNLTGTTTSTEPVFPALSKTTMCIVYSVIPDRTVVIDGVQRSSPVVPLMYKFSSIGRPCSAYR